MHRIVICSLDDAPARLARAVRLGMFAWMIGVAACGSGDGDVTDRDDQRDGGGPVDGAAPPDATIGPDASCGAPAEAAPIAVADADQVGTLGIVATGDGVFWVDREGYAVWRGKVGEEAEQLAAGQPSPNQIAVSGSTAYFTTWDAVMQLPLPDGTPTALAAGQASPDGLAVDQEHVYWGNYQDDTVMRIRRDGSGGPEPLVDGQQGVYRIAVDQDSLYWVTFADATVMRSGKDGSDPVAIAEGQTGVSDVAVAGDHVYWVTRGTIDTPGVVARAPRGGGDVTILATDGDAATDLEVRDGTLYWVNLSGYVQSIALDGQCRALLAYDSVAGVNGVAVDATHVYWTNLNEGNVWAVPR
jgi:hypothetical protein